jgi:hypothetical protein
LRRDSQRQLRARLSLALHSQVSEALLPAHLKMFNRLSEGRAVVEILYAVQKG